MKKVRTLTTHELARQLLSLPDGPVYRREPTHNYLRQVLAAEVHGVYECRFSADGGTVREGGEYEQPDDVTAYVIE